MRTLSTVFFFFILAIIAARTPYIVRNPPARPGWLASICTLIALLCLGFIVPPSALDQVLGNVGLWNLLGAISTTLAFWFMNSAIHIYASKPVHKSARYWLTASLIVFGSLFFAVEGREQKFGSIDLYINSLIGQLTMTLYLCIYLATVAAISCVSLMTVVRSGRKSLLFTVGYVLVILGNAVDIALLILQHIFGSQLPAATALYNSYSALFFIGVIILALGFLKGTAVNAIRFCWYAAMAHRTGLILLKAGKQGTLGLLSLLFHDPQQICYQNVVEIRNLITFEDLELGSKQSLIVDRVESSLERVKVKPS